VVSASVVAIRCLILSGSYRDYLIVGSAALLFAWLLLKGAENAVERRRIAAISVLFVFASLFWMGFEQAGSSLTLFADRITDNQFFGRPSSWFQSVEPFS
jgi:POT family proton-dependent oligopeptide transporter